MIYAFPDFYPEFHCIASECGHSCCRGWEIDIDKDSFEYYQTVGGAFGEQLQKAISPEPEPHFILREQERCPFLREDGLCGMILELGEESLCEICREHPRFYNELPDRLEAGLGLCCEEAVRLLLAGEKPLQIVEQQDGDAYESSAAEEAKTVIERRNQLLAILVQQDRPLAERMQTAAKSMNCTVVPFDPVTAAGFYLTLEQMDPAWKPLLERLCAAAEDTVQNPPEGIRYERMLEYFIYRHFTAGKTEREQRLRFQFSVLSIYMISALEQVTSVPIAEVLRMYSSEIEYSDENVDKLLQFIDCQRMEQEEI